MNKKSASENKPYKNMTSEEIEMQKIKEMGPFKARPLKTNIFKPKSAESVRGHSI